MDAIDFSRTLPHLHFNMMQGEKMSLYNKALVLSGPNKLRIKKRDIPLPGCNEVLIKVMSASVCHTDSVVISGQYSRIKYPTVPGHEFSGIVEQVGLGVNNFHKGDRVTALGYYYCGICNECRRGRYTACIHIKGLPMDTDGAFQQYIVCPENALYMISQSISLETASLTEPAANGYAAARRGDIKAGDTVVVIGPGAIGLTALQAARINLPEHLIMLGTRQERLALAKHLGATHIINVKETDAYQSIMGITQGKGVDVVLFCGGGEDAWALSANVLRHFGRIVVEALPEPYNAKWGVPICEFTEKSIAYLGTSGYTPQEFAETLGFIESGMINVDMLITHRFSLDDYQKAFETALNRTDGAIKVIIQPNK